MKEDKTGEHIAALNTNIKAASDALEKKLRTLQGFVMTVDKKTKEDMKKFQRENEDNLIEMEESILEKCEPRKPPEEVKKKEEEENIKTNVMYDELEEIALEERKNIEPDLSAVDWIVRGDAAPPRNINEMFDHFKNLAKCFRDTMA